jgi:hypothetical protein
MCCGKEVYEEWEQGRIGLTRRQVLKAMGVGSGIVALSSLGGCISLVDSDHQIRNSDVSEVTASSSSPWVEVRKGRDRLQARLVYPRGESLGLDFLFESNTNKLMVKYRINKKRFLVHLQSPQGRVLKSITRAKNGLQALVESGVIIDPPRVSDLKDRDKVITLYEDYINMLGLEKLQTLDELIEIDNESFILPKYKEDYNQLASDPAWQTLKDNIVQKKSILPLRDMVRLYDFLDDQVVQGLNQALWPNPVYTQYVDPGDGGGECAAGCVISAIGLMASIASLVLCATVVACVWGVIGFKAAEAGVALCIYCTLG